jgi:hypothetical protein
MGVRGELSAATETHAEAVRQLSRVREFLDKHLQAYAQAA